MLRRGGSASFVASNGIALVSSFRSVSSTPWKPQNLTEVHEVPKTQTKQGFVYASKGERIMNAENSRILGNMQEKINKKWYDVDPVHAVMVGAFLFACYYVGRIQATIVPTGKSQ